MASDPRVCPFCGEPPGQGVFCERCGRNLSGVERLPTRSAWAAAGHAGSEEGAGAATAEEAPEAVAERCAAATSAFLEAMHAGGDPDTTTFPVSDHRGIGRTPKVEGWVVRPVERDDEVQPRTYRPGLVLSTAGAYHQLDSELRGWGQRDFPRYHHTVAADPMPAPAELALVDELAEVLRASGL